MCREKKEQEDLTRRLKDSMDASTRGLKDYIEKSKEKLIIVASDIIYNMRTN